MNRLLLILSVGLSLAFPLAGTTAVGPVDPSSEGPQAFAQALVDLSIGDASALERNTGHTNARFTVTLSAASEQTVTVDYATWTVRIEGDSKDQAGAPAHFVAEGKLDDLGSYHRTLAGTWSQGAAKGNFKMVRD